jgi:hypothetical protein
VKSKPKRPHGSLSSWKMSAAAKAPVIFFGIATKVANGIEKGAVFEVLTRAHEM